MSIYFGDPRLPHRFWAKAEWVESGCWLWRGAFRGGGYGQYTLDGGKVHSRAHRVAYEALVGAIPDGLVIDHLCRVRHCVNPAHLEPVTIVENIRRGEVGAHLVNSDGTCRNGLHPWPESMSPATKYCRLCSRENTRRYKARKKAREQEGTA